MLIYSKINRICFASGSTLLLMFQSLRMILHKIQNSTFTLSGSNVLFSGFALWNSFHLFFIFRSSIFCGSDADDDDGDDDDDDDGGGDDDDSK